MILGGPASSSAKDTVKQHSIAIHQELVAGAKAALEAFEGQPESDRKIVLLAHLSGVKEPAPIATAMSVANAQKLYAGGDASIAHVVNVRGSSDAKGVAEIARLMRGAGGYDIVAVMPGGAQVCFVHTASEINQILELRRSSPNSPTSSIATAHL